MKVLMYLDLSVFLCLVVFTTLMHNAHYTHVDTHTKKSLYPDRSFPLLILIETTILSNFSYGTATNNLQVISFSVVALISEDVSCSQLLDADF